MASLQRAALTIPNGGQDSNELTSDSLRNCQALSIQAPAALTGVVTVQSGSEDADNGLFTSVQSPPGTDVTIAADKTTVLTTAPFPRIRLHSTLPEVATRTFIVWIHLGE